MVSGYLLLGVLAGPDVLTLSYRVREHRCGGGDSVVGDPAVHRLGHALGVAVPGGHHVGGDPGRTHPRDVAVAQLAQCDRLEPGGLALGGELLTSEIAPSAPSA